MSKITFTYENEYPAKTKLTYETGAVTLNDILEDFEHFLRGAGFVFNGTLDFVQEEDVNTFTTDSDLFLFTGTQGAPITDFNIKFDDEVLLNLVDEDNKND